MREWKRMHADFSKEIEEWKHMHADFSKEEVRRLRTEYYRKQSRRILSNYFYEQSKRMGRIPFELLSVVYVITALVLGYISLHFNNNALRITTSFLFYGFVIISIIRIPFDTVRNIREALSTRDKSVRNTKIIQGILPPIILILFVYVFVAASR